MRRIPLVLSIIVGLVGLDQWTKVLAQAAFRGHPTLTYLGDLFRFEYAENPGAFLSLGAALSPGARFWILTVIVGLFLLGLVVYLLWDHRLRGWQLVAFSLLAGGGISNFGDRLFRRGGTVVDFMNLGIGPVRTGVFNVADVAIMVGIGIFLLQMLRERNRT